MRRVTPRLRYFALLVCLAQFLAPSVRGHEGMHEQIAEVTRQIKREPKNASLYLKRGELHRIHRDWNAALADFRRAEQLDSHLRGVQLARGRTFSDAGKPEQAREWLNGFLSVEPNHVEGLTTRARVLMKLGHHLEAAEDFSRVIDYLSKPSPEHYIERAQAVIAAGPAYVDQAVAGIDEGIIRLGPIVTLQLRAIELELANKRYTEALVRVEQIASQSARKEKWMVQRGEILLIAGRRDEARESFTAALAAIESLPGHAKETKATQELRTRARAALGQ